MIAVYYKANSRHVGLMKRMKYMTKDVSYSSWKSTRFRNFIYFLIRIIILPCILYWPNSDKGLLPCELINSRILYHVFIDFIAD
jgi:hypothetical protein